MPETNAPEDMEQARLMLDLLDSVERNSAQSQRILASEFGVALGLVNAYLKRCVRKGLVKVKEVPARRYAYFLTPQGFAEKSRLTMAYLTRSLSFFREARKDCAETLAIARERRWSRVVILGRSDLAEIAVICALEANIAVHAVVDAGAAQSHFLGAPVCPALEKVPEGFDGAIVTDMVMPHETHAAAVKRLGASRVLAPLLLGIAPLEHGKAA